MAPAVFTRSIDNDPAVRTTEMKVLNLGLCRTGTLSMYTALNRLGFHSYHMLEAIKQPARDLNYWREGMEIKFAHDDLAAQNGHADPSARASLPAPYARKDFDKLLGRYDSTCDVPTALFVKELVAAYPDAKVLLTVRTPESWARSMMTSVGVVLGWRSWALLQHFDRAFVKPWWTMARCIGERWGTPTWTDEAVLVQTYKDHVELVKTSVPKENLLVFGAKEVGGCGYSYEPLCEFLGVPVPKGEAYPRINDAENFIEIHVGLWAFAVAKMLGQLALPVAAGAAAWWWYSK